MLGDGWTSVSPVEIYVQRACDPSLHEPNYAVHLELAEYINTKKANTPREAAMAIVRLINHRNPHVSMLALGLLDSLVQGCGYAFHLQISTKEFLNELVRRFPERPPPFPGPVMQRILETIHAWKNGICQESRWKEDLGNIRDMHRLLTFKGYRFRDLPAQHAIPGTSALKSPEELEADDREAQAAKLQELIRRGTPRDLAAAQELMKIMAGAKPEAKPDYRAQTLTELSKLQGKVVLLNEMLDNVDSARGERFAAGDAYHQVSLLLVQARPKIQKWIGNAETADDPESLETLLQVNDQINAVLARYEAFKSGDYSAAANPVPPELASTSRGQAQQKNDLINLLDDEPAPAASAGGGVNELADLFSSPAPAPAPAQPQPQTDPRANILAAFNSPSPSPGGIALPGAITLPGSPQPQASAQTNPAFQQAQSAIWGASTPSAAASSAGLWGPNAATPPAPPQYAQAQMQWGQQQRTGTPSSLGQQQRTGTPSSWGGMPSSVHPAPPPAGPSQAATTPAPAPAPAPAPKKDPFADLEGLF